MDLRQDIYYQKDYVSLYLQEGEELFEFEYQENGYYFYQLAIKRPIKKIGNQALEDIYYDLETAYGYGGYLSNTQDHDFITKAWAAYTQKCLEEKIIAEFVRYHPFNKTHEYLPHDFIVADRKIVWVDLSLNKEERWATYPSKVRNILRRCEKKLSFSLEQNIDIFIDLYNKTMKKNNADDFYYFSEKYFEKLSQISSFELFSVKNEEEEILSTSFFNFSRDFIHYHLSANNYDMPLENSNYFILDQIFEKAREKGIKKMILGGGRSNQPDDSLLKFKLKFSDKTENFYIGGQIFNHSIYEKYNQIWEESHPDNTIKYFLKYRL